MPFRLFSERNRAMAFLAMLFVPSALFGVFFFLTQYLQIVLGMSAVQSGFAFLPFSATIVIGSRIVPITRCDGSALATWSASVPRPSPSAWC